LRRSCTKFQRLNSAEIVGSSLKRSELSIAQVSPCRFLRYLDAGGTNYIVLPIPIARVFHHNSIYVRAQSLAITPSDLNGTGSI
jgi:hypothetical protein